MYTLFPKTTIQAPNLLNDTLLLLTQLSFVGLTINPQIQVLYSNTIHDAAYGIIIDGYTRIILFIY
jgi:hypothetical protein